MALTETPPVELGWQAKDFSLEGIDGESYSLDKARGKNSLLVMFICNHCPFVKAIAKKLVRDAKDLENLGIGVIAINSNDTVAYPDDSFANMKIFAKANEFEFPYVIDETQEVARNYGAVCTPDFFGFDKDLKLQYRGRLDSSGMNNVPDATRDLYEAMKQVAETGKAPTKQYNSIGCNIKWREA